MMNDKMYIKQSIEEISEDKKGFISWIKAHKKQLILAGLSITTLISIVLSLKNKDSIMKFWNSLKFKVEKVPSKCNVKIDSIGEQVQTAPIMDVQVKSEPVKESVDKVQTVSIIDAHPVRNYTFSQNEFDVKRHIRTLPEGQCHSAEKAAEAAALGIDLLPNQTLVKDYVKGGAIA